MLVSSWWWNIILIYILEGSDDALRYNVNLRYLKKSIQYKNRYWYCVFSLAWIFSYYFHHVLYHIFILLRWFTKWSDIGCNSIYLLSSRYFHMHIPFACIRCNFSIRQKSLISRAFYFSNMHFCYCIGCCVI